MIFTRDKSFYHSFRALFWPLVLQNVINLSVNLTDNLLLGHHSEAALAGATSVNLFQFFLQCLIGGVGGGLVTLGSQYWGEKRTEPIRRLSAIAFWINLGFALVLFAAASLFPEGMVRLFAKDPAIIREGAKYLAILKYSFPVFAVSSIFLFSLNCVETVKVSFWLSIQAFVVNAGLNLILIPRMGSEGSATSTLIARVISLILCVLYMALRDKKLRLRLSDLKIIDRALLRDFLRVASPVVAIGGLWGLSTLLQTIILGHMTENAIAAYSASTTLYNLMKSAAQGSATAAGILMAKTVVTGRMDKVREYSRTMQAMFAGIGVATAILLFAAKFVVFPYYRDSFSPETMRLANQFILILCVACVGMAYQMPTITGIIRGGGDTKFGMINDLVSIWGFVLPVSALAAFKFGWPPVAVVALLNSDQIFKCGAAFVRVNRYRWVRKLTKPEAELIEDA